MKSRRQATPFNAALALPVVYSVGQHALSIVYVADGRWTVSVDGGPASGTFGTQVEAWEAGVRAAEALDRAQHT